MSKKWENLKLRAAYREDNPSCEIAYLLTLTGQRATSGGRPEVHHIGGRGHGPYDVVSNLITLGFFAHEWLHNASPARGRVICLYAKMTKAEFDIGELDAAMGARRPDAHPLEEWLLRDGTAKACDATVWRKMLQELIEAVTKGT